MTTIELFDQDDAIVNFEKTEYSEANKKIFNTTKRNIDDCKIMENICYQTEGSVLLIEGGHLYAATRELNFNIEFRELYDLFHYHTKLVRIIYYNNVIMSKEKDHNPIVPLARYLSYNNYSTNIETIDDDYTDNVNKYNSKNRIIADMMLYAHMPNIDHIFIVGGSSQYKYATKLCQKLGKKVTMISSQYRRSFDSLELTHYNSISNELRSTADYFVDLADLAPYIIGSGR